MSEEQPKQPEEGQQPSKGSSLAIDPILLERAKKASGLPLPAIDDSWGLTKVPKSASKKRLFGLLKPKELGYEMMADLRKASIMSPGNTMMEVQKLRKSHPSEPSLLMLSATCASGMMLNSASSRGIMDGLKAACRDAGGALLADGLSLYNLDAFLNIYFNYLNRYKREQAAVYKLVQNDHRLDSEKRKIGKAIGAVEYLHAEKAKNQAILGHLKKKLKSSLYTSVWHSMEIRSAIKAVEAGKNKEETSIGTAIEMVSHLYAMLIALARVPMATPVVDSLLELFPDGNINLFLRKRSVIGIRRMSAVKLAQALGDRKAVAQQASLMFKECAMVLGKIEGQVVKQSFEAEPYINAALAAQITTGLLHPEEQIQRLEFALKTMQNLIRFDMSKGHRYTEAANTYTHSLNNMIATFQGPSAGSGEDPGAEKKGEDDD